MLCCKRKDETTSVHVRLLMGRTHMSQNSRSERLHMHACLSLCACNLSDRPSATRDHCNCGAGDQLQPPFTHVASTPCGRTAAVCTPHAVHVLRWQGSKQSKGRLVAAGVLAMPQSPSARPITAVSLAANKNMLAIATTEERLELYDTGTLMPLDWLQGCAGVAAKLDTLSGHVQELCFRPSGAPKSKGSLMLCSHTHVCHVCLDSLAAGVPLSGAGIAKPARHLGKPSFVGDEAGAAMRVMEAGGVVLGAQWVSKDCFMLVQGSWDDVGDLPPPLILKVYGA